MPVFLGRRYAYYYVCCLLLLGSRVAVQADVVAIPDRVNFGVVSADSEDMRTASFILTNRGGERVAVTGFLMEQEVRGLFGFPPGQLPFEIEARTERERPLGVRCTPGRAPAPGRYTALLKILYTGITSSQSDTLEIPLEITIQENRPPSGTSFTFIIPDVSASVGDTVDIPVIARQTPTEMRVLGGYSIGLEWNASLLTPLAAGERGRIFEGTHTVLRNGTFGRPIRAGDTLFTIRMIALLGDAIRTPLVFSGDVRLFMPDGTLMTAPVNVRDGTFSLDNVFFDGDSLPRLITAAIPSLTLAAAPNPSAGAVRLTARYQGRPVLQVFDLNGRIIEDASQNLVFHPTLQERNIVLPASLFPREGAFIARLSLGTQSVSILLIRR